MESLFPGALQKIRNEAREEARTKAREEVLQSFLGSIRRIALKSNRSFEETIDEYHLPEWCTREEALRRMYAM